MLFEFLIIFQTGLLLLFFQAYSKRDEVLWAMSTVLSGILVFLFYSFSSNDTSIIAAFNGGIFLISIVWFFIDLMANRTSEVYKTDKLRKKDLKGIEDNNGNANTTTSK